MKASKKSFFSSRHPAAIYVRIFRHVIVHHGILDEGVALIQKPFSMAEMAEKVRVILDMTSDKNEG